MLPKAGLIYNNSEYSPPKFYAHLYIQPTDYYNLSEEEKFSSINQRGPGNYAKRVICKDHARFFGEKKRPLTASTEHFVHLEISFTLKFLGPSGFYNNANPKF